MDNTMNGAMMDMTVTASPLDGQQFIPILPSPTLFTLLQRLALADGKADGYLANPAVIAQMEAPSVLPHSFFPKIDAAEHGAHQPFALIPLMTALLLAAGLMTFLQSPTLRKNKRYADTPAIQP